MPAARMRPVHLLLLGAAAAVVIAVPVTRYVVTQVYVNGACVVELQPIQQTREIAVLTWPVPPEAAQIPAPRRSVQRKRNPLTAAPLPVEQCAFPPSAGLVPDLEPNGANPVPEPSSLSLVAVALVGVGVLRRKRKTGR